MGACHSRNTWRATPTPAARARRASPKHDVHILVNRLKGLGVRRFRRGLGRGLSRPGTCVGSRWLLNRLLSRPGGRLGCLRKCRWHDEEVEVEDEVDVAVHSRSRTRVIQLRRASCVDGVTFGAWSKSGASSIGVRTACSNTDAGPAVPAVAALLRCTDGIPSAHVRSRRNPFRLLSLAQTNESEPV